MGLDFEVGSSEERDNDPRNISLHPRVDHTHKVSRGGRRNGAQLDFQPV